MTREQLVGRPLPEVFADDGKPSGTSSMAALEASLRQVISTGQAHQMPVQSYSFPDPGTSGALVKRYRSSSNTPVLDENGEVMYIIHQATLFSRPATTNRERAFLRLPMTSPNWCWPAKR